METSDAHKTWYRPLARDVPRSRDRAIGHLRAASAPILTIDEEQDSPSPAHFSKSTQLYLVRNQQSPCQLHLPTKEERSTAQLRRLAIRLAARPAASNSPLSSHKKSLLRARMSHHKIPAGIVRGREAEMGTLCSTLDEKEPSAKNMTGTLAPIAPFGSSPQSKA
jgi:hypothetical protein